MKRRMTWREYQRWIAFNAVEPIDLEFYYMAQIAQMQANCFRGKNQRAFGLGDFILNAERKQPQPLDAMIKAARLYHDNYKAQGVH